VLADGACPHLIHPERHYTYPGETVEGVNLDTGRKKARDIGGGNGPVSEEEIVPTLAHSPSTGRQRVGPMGDGVENVRVCG
jgi:hypothetical protein